MLTIRCQQCGNDIYPNSRIYCGDCYYELHTEVSELKDKVADLEDKVAKLQELVDSYK